MSTLRLNRMDTKTIKSLGAFGVCSTRTRMLSFLITCSLLAVASGFTLKQDQPNNVIVNGYSAEEGKAPYIVGLTMDGSYLCGGSIIGNEWVITAAHCVSSANSVEIHYGSNWGWKGKFSHTVDKSNIIVYPEYNLKEGTDIALIRTPHVEFSEKVNKVPLPSLNERNEHYENWWAVSCGWGGMADGNLAEWLQCMDVQITTKDECKNAYNQVGYADSFICTRDKASDGDSHKSVCGGDSGGPLVTHDAPRLVGITALVYVGCKEGPSGFTRVSAYVDWIHEKTGIYY